ncbi:transmembrane protein 256 homolog [Acropora millepora]|uniref:transmembrane protein 256 homolog n=1 Tax=Acropora millepora TaxID=45264 RepID=UPI001CF4F0C2|nr:transmembrane protein 256 homolog [Acropora millepora]
MAWLSLQTFQKLAGISGALAVALGAYGAHAPSLNKESAKKYKEVFMTGNLYHHIHNLALLAMPFAKRPLLFGGLLSGGVLLFSGSCYVVGLSEDRSYGKLAPVGGFMFMAGWLAFAF